MTNLELTRRSRSFLRSKRCFAALACCAATSAIATLGSTARADDTIKTPGDHPHYAVEIEPHLTFADDGIFAEGGYGVGARFSIPVVQNGFIPSINNSVAVSFGADLVHYDECYFHNNGCGATYLLIPVALQWNFFVARQFSVFAEPGLFLYNGFEDDNVCAGLGGCNNPSRTGVRPALAIGGRWHLSDRLALTLRIGYPTASIGLSIL
jgi:hypothetical protein